MKNLKLILPLLFILSILSCTKEDDVTGRLIGTWVFGSAFVDGLGTTASGSITFGENNQNEIDVWYLIEADTIRLEDAFVFIETSTNVELILGNRSINFSRNDNTNNKQEFQFNTFHNQKEYSIIFDMIRE